MIRHIFLFTGLLCLFLNDLPAQIEELADLDHPRSSEYAITIHPDGSAVVFQSDRHTDWNLYVSFRSGKGWSQPETLFPDLPDGTFVGGPCFSANGAQLLFFSDMEGSQRSLDLFRMKYDADSRTFGPPESYDAPVNTENYEAFPTISPDGKLLIYAAEPEHIPLDLPGEQEKSCYTMLASWLNHDGTWGIPDTIRFDGLDCIGFPRLMPDGETLIFSAWNESGKTDLYRSKFTLDPTTGLDFTAPQTVESLNSPEDDKLVGVTYNGAFLVFSRAEPVDSWEEPDLAMYAPGRLLPDVAGWTWVDMLIQTPESNPMEADITVRTANDDSGDKSKKATSEGAVRLRLRSGQSYTLTASAPGHDFQSIPLDLSSAHRPDTISRTIQLTPLKREITIRLDDLNFAYNSAEISDTAAAILDIAADFLKTNEGIKVEIAAHTDDIGSPEFNLDLSQQRANAVVEALVARGTSRIRLISKGYGESSPIAENQTETGRALNRRVEFRILEE